MSNADWKAAQKQADEFVKNGKQMSDDDWFEMLDDYYESEILNRITSV